MSVKYYCDWCGKETSHMDLQDVKGGKHICPECMKVRCWDMAKAILIAGLEYKSSDEMKFLYINMAEIIVRLNLQDELEEAKHAYFEVKYE